jgi:hypothetical protein
METFPSFIKLWGHIDETLSEGTNYTFLINNTYDVSDFDGKKWIYLSEVNAFGGTNIFLGIAFFVFAGVVVLIMIIFTFLYCIRIRGKDLYSTENLKW